MGCGCSTSGGAEHFLPGERSRVNEGLHRGLAVAPATLVRALLVVAGNPEIEITGLSTIEEAGPGQLTFLTNRKYNRHLATTKASAVITDQTVALPPSLSGIISQHPYLTFAQALNMFFAPPIPPREIHG